MTREQKILDLVRRMTGPARRPAGSAQPRSGLFDPSLIADIIDALPDRHFAGKDRNRVKLDYLARSIGAVSPAVCNDPPHSDR